MKKIFYFVILFLSVYMLYSQEVPSGIRMGMGYTQISHIMTNGDWQPRQGNSYIFFSHNPAAIYSFSIDPSKGLVAIQINLIETTLSNVVQRLTRFYGVPVRFPESYIWGANENLPDNIYIIDARVNPLADMFIEVTIVFLNELL